ncbi:MAG: membrane dipeptidase, partial [Chlamydiae bacterium]|nr:membrane dipeptidase [Chlamydiota bacterium]
MHIPVVDLHCDLLAYLRKNKTRTIYDLDSRCSYPQLKEGNVKLQVLAIFTETESGSEKMGEEQVAIAKKLSNKKSNSFSPFTGRLTEEISFLPAFENSSSFCGEDEPLSKGLNRLEKMVKDLGKILSISLTWNGENRFGGGVGSFKGLKKDGEHLLEWMDQKGIAVDFSHASDFLAYDILNHIEKKKLSIPVMASHSNFRSIQNELRNLPDELAKEIA